MNSENINYEYKSLIYRVFIGAVIILTIIKIIYTRNNEVIFTSEIICFLISIIIYVVSILKVDKRHIGILRLVGIGYLFIAILKIISTQVLFKHNENTLVIIFNEIVILIQMINLCSSIIIFKTKLSTAVQWIIFSFISLFISILTINLDSFTEKVYELSITYTGRITILLITLILFLNIIFLYKRFKLDNSFKWIIKSGFFMIFTNILLFIDFIFKINLGYSMLLINLIPYFLVYNELEKVVLKRIYLNTHEVLNSEMEMKDNLNKSLIKRKKVLKDTNKLLEKSEKKYYELVQALSNKLLIFENNILVDSIHFDNEYLNKINYKNTKITIHHILSKITGETYLENIPIPNLNKNIKMKSSRGLIKHYEIYLLNLYDNKSIVVFNDITDIIKRREDIIKIKERIKEKEINDEFYSNISHELRTPINVIYSALQLNDIYLIKGIDEDKIKKNNDIIRQNCLRLNRTINNFIDSNKLSEGYLSLDLHIYNIVNIIEDLLEVCSYYIDLKKVKYIYDPEYEEIYIKCDKNYIERVMLNILSNYIKHGKNDMTINISVKVDKDNLIIEVSNDADTIPENKRKDIFEKFTKVDSSLSRPSEGSGLGLYLSKGLIELHNGEISMLPGENVGNIFRIVLPYDENLKVDSYLKSDREINELKHKVKIEFADIYF